MKDRNEFIESDGLYWTTDTHEWFNNKSLTMYAQKEGIHNDALYDIFCFWVRNILTGEYVNVVMDRSVNEIVCSSDSSDVLTFIDKLKVEKRFGIDKIKRIANAFEQID